MLESHLLTYYSSYTENLLDALCHHLQADPHSPVNTAFGRAQILVPNSGMQRYLELKIAKRFGICSHIDIDYVGQLLATTYKNLFADESPAHLDERLLTFALLRLWERRQLPPDSAFSRLYQQYSQSRQRYFFAQKIAGRLRRYSNERPEMIDAWQADKLTTRHLHEPWQREIFQQLFCSLGITHRSRLDWHERFAEALTETLTETTETHHANHTLPSHHLPAVIHVFGFHALPVAQLTDLLAIGQVTQVRFYTFNPCMAYWQDIVPEKIKMRAEITHADEAELLCVGHPLLASWGQSGKYYIEQLNEYPNYNLDEMVAPPAPDSVLTWLQSDIRKLSDEEDDKENNKEDDKKNHLGEIFAEETASGRSLFASSLPGLSLHACANPRREVEVLYDHLCRAFAHSDLNPADVLVVVPKLGDYAPHIQAVFSRDKNRVHVPYSLANLSSAESDPDVQAFLSLLAVLDNNFQAQLLFECLSSARIQEALRLSQSHLDSLRNWLTDSRYSLHFYDNGAGESSSLEKLLDSLLLASVGGEDAELGKRRASPLYYGGQREPLTQLCELWQRFVPFVGLKKQRLTLTGWLAQLRRLCDTFLPPRQTMEAWLNDWYETLSPLADSDDGGHYDFAAIRADLSALLQNDTLYGPFLSGGVSFCAVVPMRSIPAKMIAVLGLNSDFPAVSAKDPLDLRLSCPLWSDRNAHKEQQYFFLETLMAAREKLYLSYVGLDEKTGGDLPPSALVSELFGYIERKLPGFSSAVTTKYPLQGFVSEDSYQTLYNTPTERERTTNSEQEQQEPVTLPESLTAAQLADVLLEPLTAYWRYHLGAEPLDALSEPLAEHEFIAADSGLDRWQYRHTALNISLNRALSADHTVANEIADLKQHNRYAPEVISKALLNTADNDIRPLFKVLNALELSEKPKIINAPIKQTVADCTIYLRLHAEHYCQQGLLSYHVGRLDSKKYLRTWVKHVLYHCLPDAKPCQSRLFTLDKGRVSQTVFAPLVDSHSAQSLLSPLLALVHTLIQKPYPMTLKLSGKKAETTLHYEAEAYPLYTQIPVADATMVRELQARWAVLDAELSRYRVPG